MSNQHPIDDLFRQQAGQRAFPFRESYWQQAEQMIVAAQKKRKKSLLSLLSYSLLLVTVVSIPLLTWMFSDREPLPLRPLSMNIAAPDLMVPPPDAPTEQVLWQASPVPGPSQIVFPFGRERSGLPGRTDNANFPNEPVIEIFDREISLTPLDGPRFETTLNAIDLPVMVDQQNVPGQGYKRHELSLWAGFNALPRLEGAYASLNDWNTHPLVGLRYAYSFSSRIKAFTGLFYQGRGGLNADTVIRSINYGFGADIESTVISPRRLHYLEVPLGLDVRLHKNHYLLAGGQFSYLLNASGSVVERKENSFGLQSENEAPAWGYTQGFQPWNASLMGGYAWYWQKGIRLGALANYDLRNAQKTDYFTDRQLASRLQLRVFVEVYLSHF